MCASETKDLSLSGVLVSKEKVQTWGVIHHAKGTIGTELRFGFKGNLFFSE